MMDFDLGPDRDPDINLDPDIEREIQQATNPPTGSKGDSEIGLILNSQDRSAVLSNTEEKARAILLETELAKKKIDDEVHKELIRLEAIAVDKVRLMVESSKAKLQLDLEAQNRLAHLDQRWR